MASEKKVHIPEVVEPDESLTPDLRGLRRLSYLLDAAIRIPGTNRRVGLDAGIGLIPGAGDVVGGLFSTAIVIGAVRHRVPLSKILRMLLNVGIDIVIGSIPVLGDIFDFLFEENVANMQILLRHRNRNLPPRTFSQMFIATTVIVLAVLGLCVAVASVWIALALWLIAQRNR